MSATIPTPVDVVAVTEPVVNVTAKPKYGVIAGAETVSWQAYPASSVSAGSVAIQANQPNRSTLIDRRVLIQLTAHFSFTGTVPGGGVPLLNIGVSDAFRAYPITSVTNNMKMSIGSKAVSCGQMDQFWPQILRYHNPVAQRDSDYSITPAMLDQYQEYSQGLATNRNPLAGYGANSTEMTRGGWTQSQITNYNPAFPALPGTITETFDVVLQEPLFLSPFIFARGDNEAAFIGVDTFNFNMNFDSLSRMWSRFNVPGGSVINPLIAGQGITVTLTGAALLFRQLTPNPLVPIPRSLAYSYFNPVIYQTQGPGPIVPGAQATLQSSVITLPGIPRRLYIWASEVPGNQTFLTSDTMFGITNVTLKWGTKTYLREATPVQLYQIAVKNGSTISWPQWSQFTGALLCLQMGSDVGLSVTETAGSEGKFQLQVALGCTNLNPTRTILPNLNIVAVQEGVIEIRDGAVYINENPVTAADVLNARGVPGLTYKDSESIFGGGVVGGSFFGDVLSGIKKVANVAARGVQAVAPIAQFIPIPGLGQAASIASRIAPVIRGITGGRRHAMRSTAPKRAMHRAKGGRRGRALLHRLKGRGLALGEESETASSGGEEAVEHVVGGSADEHSEGDSAEEEYLSELLSGADEGVSPRD